MQYVFEPDFVAVGNEDLTETFAGHDADQLFDALHVELVEDVVQQQDRPNRTVAGYQIELGQLQRDEKRLLLSLGTVFAQRIVAEGHTQVVTVHAACSVLVRPVLWLRIAQDFIERQLVQFRPVFQFDLFSVAGQCGVISRYVRRQFVNQLFAPCVDIRSESRHL